MVESPCDGEVLSVFDGVTDNPIGDEGGHPSNHIVVRCRGHKVTLAHLMKGSLLVDNGQTVKRGQPLAKVGNSGHTSEPHLHIDAVRDAVGSSNTIEPVSVAFGGRAISWNSVVSR